jgi:uncharacterized protein YndB with AHSA1/START domain
MFETEWVLTAPVERVFEVLEHPDEFSDWWPSVKHAELLEEGDSDGVGKRAAYSIRSPIGYSMQFEVRVVEVDGPHRIHTVVRGDLIGTGTYLLESRDAKTRVRFNWYVSTTKSWMNWAARVAKPALVWAHHSVMREGCEAMARHLGARLVSTNTRLVEKPTPAPAAPHYGSSLEAP